MASTNPQPPNSSQLSPLPGVQTHITTHNTDGLAVFHSSTPGAWATLNPSMAFNVVYTTSVCPPSVNNDIDITNHGNVMQSGKLGLVNPNGTVCRIVDFGPSTADTHSTPVMHRTQSLDYGIVLEGEVECLLDSGEMRRMGRGDVAVQRGTMHAWRNRSGTEWARMVFVLTECEKVKVGEKELGASMIGGPEEIRHHVEAGK
ncbi:MAG: hypothetical protein Q9220_000381 [cf. Caloplaca sp. 1 TL-2023]